MQSLFKRREILVCLKSILDLAKANNFQQKYQINFTIYFWHYPQAWMFTAIQEIVYHISTQKIHTS